VGFVRRLAIRTILESRLFDEAYYLSQRPDPGISATAVEHYFDQRAQSEAWPNPMFDGEYYLRSNPDVAAAKINPLLHFIVAGARQNRAPHPRFDVEFYLAAYPDVRVAALNPLRHYLEHGRKEGRSICALSRGEFRYDDGTDSGILAEASLGNDFSSASLCWTTRLASKRRLDI